MGWRWVDEGPSSAPSSRRGLGEVDDILSPSPRSGEAAADRCSTRRVVRSSCRTEEVEPGRFVRKCEKTQQTLKDCVGRPVEVLESYSEHTEEDVTDEVKSGSFAFDSPIGQPFDFPGIRSDIEAVEKGIFGGLGDLLEEAERMTSDLFQSFGIPSSRGRESASFGGWKEAEGPPEKDCPKQPSESPYSEFAAEIRDV